MLNIAIIREMHIKVTVIYNTFQNGYHKQKKQTQITNVGKDVEKREPLYMVGM